jgi:hypothetical protein
MLTPFTVPVDLLYADEWGMGSGKPSLRSAGVYSVVT